MEASIHPAVPGGVPTAEVRRQVNLKTCSALFALLLSLNLAIVGIRVHSLIERGRLTATTGTEGPMVYSVWKARHNYPLYEAPALVFSNSLYNFMYYQTAASVAKVLHLDGDDLLLSTRLTTATFAVLGFVVGLITVSGFGLFSDISGVVLGACALGIFWFGTVPVGWWAWSARPDVGAACLASVGLLFFLRFLHKESIWKLLLSSLFFFLAWSFKQSIVTTFIGVVLVTLVCRRQWKFLLALVGPIGAGVAAALYLGGANYRFNILTVPSAGFLDLTNAVRVVAKPWVENPILYIAPVLALAVLVFGKKSAGNSAAALRFQVGVLGSIFLCTAAGGVLLCLRSGSDVNYFFEAGMVAAIAALPSAMLLFESSRKASGWFFSLASLIFAGVCLLQLANFFAPVDRQGIPTHLPLLGASDFGRLRLLTERQERERSGVIGMLASAPKPILVLDDVYSLPWHSTNGSYPAFSADLTLLENLRKRGMIKDDRVVTLIRSRLFASVVLSATDLISLARQNRYDFIATLPDGSSLYRRSGSQGAASGESSSAHQ